MKLTLEEAVDVIIGKAVDDPDVSMEMLHEAFKTYPKLGLLILVIKSPPDSDRDWLRAVVKKYDKHSNGGD